MFFGRGSRVGVYWDDEGEKEVISSDGETGKAVERSGEGMGPAVGFLGGAVECPDEKISPAPSPPP